MEKNKSWNWSLKELYSSFDSPEFKKDMEDVSKQIKGLRDWAKENFATREREGEKIEEYLKLTDMVKFYGLMSFSSLSLSTDSENISAIKSLDILMKMSAEMTDPNVLFDKYVAECENLDKYIQGSSFLKEHEFYLKEKKEKAKYQLSDKEESLIAKLRNTGSGAWSQMKEQLAATVSADINIDGKDQELTLSMVRNLAKDESGDVRKKAYEAELKSYKKIDKAVAASLNAIKGEVITLCEMRGYASPLEMTVKQSRLDMETLEAMLSAMKDFLPVFHKFYRYKAEMLGHKNGLPWFDILAPVGSVSMKFTIEEAADYIVKNFSDFSEKLGKFARHAFDNDWIDVFPKKGKRGGAFCAGVQPLKESRILTNFDGSFDAMLTLAHELGHGYHNLCLKEQSAFNKSVPMPVAETASTFCETLVARAALKTASKEEAFVIRDNDISGNAQVIVDIYSRFLFEDEVFKRRAKGSLSVDELNDIMIDSQKKSYGDGLDHNYLNPGMWINKTHYYSGTRSYYNFPYAYGQLFALGLYAQYVAEGKSFTAKYDDMLAATGKNTLADIGKLMGIDVKDKNFWVSSLKIIEKEIKEFCGFEA